MSTFTKYMKPISTVLWEKWVEFKFEWVKITASGLISPLLYMIALGWGLGSARAVSDRPYIDFLVPGIIALTTMNTSFNAVSSPLCIQKQFEHSFDQLVISPTPIPSYIIGQMIGGMIRGMYAGVLILLLSLPFGASMKINAAFFLVMMLNGLAFAGLGVTVAIMAKRHSDVARFTTFAILPMTFLCNTFFPLDQVPAIIKALISILPLTHASGCLRAIAYGQSASVLSILILAAYAAVFMIMAMITMSKREMI